ncbi:MAG: glycosyltransferase, partial [Ilumatobacteraceae bacterium]
MGAFAEDQPVNGVDVSVVIPVYQGRETLRPLIDAIAPMTQQTLSPEGRSYNVSEVILIDDCGPDRSGEVIDALATEFTFVRRARLMRNYGEHAAVAAG